MAKYDHFRWGDLNLSKPAPLDAAVEAGIFGVCADGSMRPSSQEIAAMTEEHARNLADTLCRLRHLERCLARHLNPHTGRELRDWEIREREERSMRRGVANLNKHYAGCLAAYVDAFGDDAAEHLDREVRKVLELPEFALEPIEIQRALF